MRPRCQGARSTASSLASPASTRATPPWSLTAATTARNAASAKPGDQARYIWDLAFDAHGALYIATGGPAAIYRVDVSTDTPHAEIFFESDEQHIRCLLFEPNGDLIAGSDGGGLVYRIGKDRKGLVIYDAPKREVTALAESADGRLYVAAVGEKTKSTLPPLPVQGIAVATATITIVTPGSVQASSSNGLIPDGSEVDELSPQGAPRKLWATRDDVVYALHATPAGTSGRHRQSGPNLSHSRGRVLPRPGSRRNRAGNGFCRCAGWTLRSHQQHRQAV